MDHPHAYGDKCVSLHCRSDYLGSSPRVWGQVIHPFCEICMIGIIPTRMGTRVVNQLRHSLHKDHPHAYGDKSSFYPYFTAVTGSSPRVWGQGLTEWERLLNVGIIPTRMGTRNQKNTQTFFLRDHPHAYGDKSIVDGQTSGNSGSSPRVWGQAWAVLYYNLL